MMVQATNTAELQNEDLARKLAVRQTAAATATTDLSAAAEAEATQTATDPTVSQAVQQAQTLVSHKPDTVEISREGRDAFAAMQQEGGDTDAASAATQAATSEVSQMAQKAEQQAETSDAETVSTSAASTSNNNLTAYTEQQLSQMVSDGSISQSEANAELQRRQAAAQSEAAPPSAAPAEA